MNKKIIITKTSKLLFVINAIILITMLLFKNTFSYLNYNIKLINTSFIINIFILIFGLIFNFLSIKDYNKFNNKKSIVIILLIFLIYLLYNTLGIYLINKPIGNGYSDITKTLASYCASFKCDKYEVKDSGDFETFVLYKKYFDYDNVENDMIIETNFDNNEVLSVKATIYSRKELFSETLIKDVVKEYIANFKKDISEQKIREAFENRFVEEIEDGKIKYKVSEIYSDKEELEKLKTEIEIKIK